MTRKIQDVAADLSALVARPSKVRGKSKKVGRFGDQALLELAAKLPARSSDLIGVDLASTYAPELMLPEGTPWVRRTANGLELFRDVLIFVPVMYTWWQISRALIAYANYTGKAPFLLAWQQGFGNHTQPLSTSAVVVAGVVLAVIVITIIAHQVRSGYDQAVRQRQQQLAALLAEASLLATQSVTNSAPDVTKAELATIGSRITVSANALQEALSRAGKEITSAVDAGPGSKLHDMYEKWIAAANELKTLGSRLQGTQEMVDQLRTDQRALSGLANKIGGETQRLLEAFEKERNQSRQEAHAHHEVATEVGQSTRTLGEALDKLNGRADQFNELILRLAFVVDRLDGNGMQASYPGGGFSP